MTETVQGRIKGLEYAQDGVGRTIYARPMVGRLGSGEGDSSRSYPGEAIRAPRASAEIARAGALLGDLIDKYTIYPSHITNGMRVNGDVLKVNAIERFVGGTDPDPDLRSILHSVAGLVNVEDPTMQEFRKVIRGINEKKNRRYEELKWIWRLQDGLQINDADKLIRLSRGDPPEIFALETGIKLARLLEIEGGLVKPSFAETNKIIKGAEFDKKYRRAAQLLRLHARGMKSVSIEGFNNGSISQNEAYLYTQLGYSQTQYAERTNSLLREQGEESSAHGDGRTPAVRVDKVRGLLPVAEFVKYMEYKAKGIQIGISPELQFLLHNDYYFAEHNGVLGYPFPSNFAEDGNLLRRPKTLKAAFERIKRVEHLSSGYFAQKLQQRTLTDLEIALLAIDSGLSILDDTALELLDLAAQERERYDTKFAQQNPLFAHARV